MTTSPATLDFLLGRRLTEIALGLDALERATSKAAGALDAEGLVPIYIGGDLVVPAAFDHYDAVHRSLDAFEPECAAIGDPVRKLFLTGMVRSLRVATRLFAGEAVSFEQKLTDLVGVPAEPVADATIAQIHDRLDRLMTARGFTRGTLSERVAAWQSGRYLEPAAIPALFDELMAVAKAKTDALIWPTGDYTMRLKTLRDVPYAGRCSFADGTMELNLDVRVTRSALKHLVCHEVFPGHSTQLLSTQALAQRGDAPLDALLVTANAVTGAVQEGIGDQGIDLIDWVEDDDDAAQIELRRLQTATGTNAAWHLHMSGWTKAQAIAYLCEVGFGQESWSTVRTGMAQHPFRAPFLASYWFGNEAVKALRENPATDRAALNAALFGSAHSIASLEAAVAGERA
jgi:hypothetical protein